jgi:hypothetical protein
VQNSLQDCVLPWLAFIGRSPKRIANGPPGSQYLPCQILLGHNRQPRCEKVHFIQSVLLLFRDHYFLVIFSLSLKHFVLTMASLCVLLDRTSRTINIVLDSTLFLICLICNLLLILLFLSPGAFHLDSLVHPGSKSFSHAVVVALTTAIFTTSTSALVTKAVEHSVWLKLAPGSSRKTTTIGESCRLAQWSASPIAGLCYNIMGQAWTFKLGGLCLVGISVPYSSQVTLKLAILPPMLLDTSAHTRSNTQASSMVLQKCKTMASSRPMCLEPWLLY